MKRLLFILVIVIVAALFFSGCATHSLGNFGENTPGFFKGLLHGFILLFSFVGSLFSDYEIYTYPNAGGWYNFGYLLGVILFFCGGGARAKR